MKRHTKTGKILFYLGVWLMAVGFAFNHTVGIADTSEQYSKFSVPLVVIGLVLGIASNFYKKSNESN